MLSQPLLPDPPFAYSELEFPDAWLEDPALQLFGGFGADLEVTDEGATLGRVLFYDPLLSIDGTVPVPLAINKRGHSPILSPSPQACRAIRPTATLWPCSISATNGACSGTSIPLASRIRCCSPSSIRMKWPWTWLPCRRIWLKFSTTRPCLKRHSVTRR